MIEMGVVMEEKKKKRERPSSKEMSIKPSKIIGAAALVLQDQRDEKDAHAAHPSSTSFLCRCIPRLK